MSETTDEIKIDIELREDFSGLSLEALQARVHASYGAFLMLEFDAALPYPEGARLAAATRWKRAWEDPEMLAHALRGEHLSQSEALALAKADRERFDKLLAEDEAREARDRKKRHDDEQEAA